MVPSWLRSRQKVQAGLLLRISRANAAAIQSAEPDVATGSALHRNDSEMVPSWLRDGSEPWRSRQKAQAGLLLRISLVQTPQQSSLLSRMLRQAAHFTGTVPRWLRVGSEPWRSRQKAQAGLLLRISLVQTPQQSSLLRQMLRQAARFTGTTPRWLRAGSEMVPSRGVAGKKLKQGCF